MADLNKMMDMSLDDYIKSLKATKDEKDAEAKNECKFKAERRVIEDDDELGDETDADMTLIGNDEGDGAIWKGPDLHTTYLELDYTQDDIDDLLEKPTKMQQHKQHNNFHNNNSNNKQAMQRFQKAQNFDLRDKISGNAEHDSVLPNSNSQQWRLMQPNVMNQRPAGMPPLVPMNTFEQQQQQQRYQKRRRQSKWGNNNRFSNNNNNMNGYGQDGVFRYNNNMFAGGRIQRGNQRNNNYNNSQEQLSNNLKAVLERLNIANGHALPQEVRDLTIVTPSNMINLSSKPVSKHTATLGGNILPNNTVSMNTNAFQMPLLHNNSTDVSSSSNKSNDSIRALLGIGDVNTLKPDMMPMLATKFLDFLQNGSTETMHKPMYDMKIQKEIHSMQRKPLLYKCPGGEVVSSDGAGINNCEVIPRTSGISLNHRFA